LPPLEDKSVVFISFVDELPEQFQNTVTEHKRSAGIAERTGNGDYPLTDERRTSMIGTSERVRSVSIITPKSLT
jgi:hypothetical protein